MLIARVPAPPSVKLYTLSAGDVFSPADEDSSVHGLVMMVQPTEGRRSHDRYADKINAVNLVNGHASVAHGSLRVVHHKNATLILDYNQS